MVLVEKPDRIHLHTDHLLIQVVVVGTSFHGEEVNQGHQSATADPERHEDVNVNVNVSVLVGVSDPRDEKAYRHEDAFQGSLDHLQSFQVTKYAAESRHVVPRQRQRRGGVVDAPRRDQPRKQMIHQ